MILDLKNVNKVYGRFCDKCLESTGAEFESSICPHCGSCSCCK